MSKTQQEIIDNIMQQEWSEEDKQRSVDSINLAYEANRRIADFIHVDVETVANFSTETFMKLTALIDFYELRKERSREVYIDGVRYAPQKESD